MILRPYQIEFAQTLISDIESSDKPVMGVAPTGAGKTIILSHIIGHFIGENNNFKALVIAHRDELTYQNENKFQKCFPGVETSKVNAKSKDFSGCVVFAMVQTLHRNLNDKFDLIVVDEAHHANAATYQKAINFYKTKNPNLKILGVTATPRPRQKFFKLSATIKVKTLIREGYLVKPETFVIDVNPNSEFSTQSRLLSLKKKASGDYADEEIAAILDTKLVNSEVVRHYKEKARNRPTVVFCSTINHAYSVHQAFENSNIEARIITGLMGSSERARNLEDLKLGIIDVVVNVSVLTEGWDFPPVSCVILLRQSSNKSIYVQMIGRGLRPVLAHEFPNIVKTDCLVIDFGVSTLKHRTLEIDNSPEKPIKCIYCKAVKVKSVLLCNITIEQSNSLCGYFTCELEKKNCPTHTEDKLTKGFSCASCGKTWEESPVFPVFPLVLQETQEQKLKKMLEHCALKKFNLIHDVKIQWTPIRDNKREVYVSGGINYSVFVIKNKDVYQAYKITINDSGTKEIRLHTQSTAPVCFRAAEDYLCDYESELNILRATSWRMQPPSEKQLTCLRGASVASKGEATNNICYFFTIKPWLEKNYIDYC